MSRMYTVNDQSGMRFFQIPKALYENEQYKSVSNGAKMMFGILRDRQDLSIANNWVDEDGYIFFYFDGDKLADYMNVSRTTIQKYKKELIKSVLMFQKRQGQGKPNRMYIFKPEAVATTLMGRNCTSGSVETVHLEVQKLLTNDTKSKETEKNETNLLHHTTSDGVIIINLLNAFTKQVFNKEVRRHTGIYDLGEFECIDHEEFTDFLFENVTKYEYANLDYLDTIKGRVK